MEINMFPSPLRGHLGVLLFSSAEADKVQPHFCSETTKTTEANMKSE